VKPEDYRSERSPSPAPGDTAPHPAGASSLWEQVLARGNLAEALRRVEQNAGAAGIGCGGSVDLPGHRAGAHACVRPAFPSPQLRLSAGALMARVARRVHDKRVRKLIRRYLEAGVTDGGLVHASEEGTPQGGLCAAAHNLHMSSAGLCAVSAWISCCEWVRWPNAAHNETWLEIGEPVEQLGVLVPFGQLGADDLVVDGFEGFSFRFGRGACVDLGCGVSEFAIQRPVSSHQA